MIRKWLCLDDKAFYNRMMSIALPIALQNLINFSVSMMDTLMVGKLGEVQLSASSVANQMSFMFMVLSFGVANGCSVLSAQHWGKGNIEQVRHIISFMYRVVLVLSILFTAVSVLVPGWVLRLFIDDALVLAEGEIYLRIVGWSFLVSGFTNASIGILRSTGTVRISLAVYSASLVTNTVLNYCLIFGKFGFPALGIAGAAIATVISRIVELLIVLVFVFKIDKNIGMRPSDLLHTGGVMRDVVRYSAPVLFNELLWSSGAMVLASIMGHMGREVVAANSICSVLFQLVQAATFGLSNAAATIIGNTIGSGDYEAANRRARAFVILAAIFGVSACIVMQLVRFPLIGFYGESLSPLAREYAYGMSAVASVLAILQTISLTLMMGVLRGGGDTRFVMVMDVMFMWLIALPFGALAGLKFGLAVPLVYLILKSEDIFKTTLAIRRVLGGCWLRDVT